MTATTLKKITLGDYAKVISGYAIKSTDFKESGVSVIKIGNIGNGDVVFDKGNTQFVPEHFKTRLHKKFQVTLGDILVSLTGSHMTQPGSVVGRVARYQYSHTSMLNQRAGKIVDIDDAVLNKSFLYYLLSTKEVRQEISLLAHGAANQANVSPKDIEKIKFNIPDVAIQGKIAAILSAYDDLIENNKRRIAILEKMAEEIYREWFVRFRFPGYQDAEFEKGIPKGWGSLPSDEVLDVLSGGTPKTDNPVYWDGDIPFFTPKDAGDGYYCFSTEKSITDAGLEKCNSRLYPKNTIFITARGTVGKISLASKAMAMNQSCYALRPKDGADNLFWFLSIKNTVSQIKGVSKSGVFDNIVVDTFKIILLLRPGFDVLKVFNNLISPMFEEVLVLSESNINLEKTKRLLLPRLISGKLSVEDLDIKFPPSMQEVG